MFAKGMIILFLTVFILYALIAVMTEVFFGLGDLNRSLQSLESFKNCVYIINTGTLLLLLLLWAASKLVACFIIYAAAVYIITSIKYKHSLIYTAALTAAFFTAEFIFYTSSSYNRISIMLREINFFSAFDPHRFFAGYINLNFFGQAVSRPAVFIVFISVMLILSGTAAKKSAGMYQTKMLAEAEKVYFDEINHRYNEFRGIWHDMQNHLLVLDRLIEDNDTKSAKSYINEFNEKITKLLLPPKTGQRGSAVLDALLFKKLETADSKGIDLKFDIAVSLGDFGITDYELCSIFGNVLDNAIDVAAKLPNGERWISLLINRRHDMLYICCENPYSGGLVRIKDGFVSSKNDKDLHGIGISRINGLVKKHNGGICINTDENIFKIEILLNSR